MTRKYQIRADGKRKRVSAKADKRIGDIARMALKKQKNLASSAFDPRNAPPLPSKSKSSRGGVGKVPSVAAATTTLPQNLLNTDGTLFEGFEDVSEWTDVLGTQSDDTTNFTSESGTQGIECDHAPDARSDMDKDVSWDFSTGDYFRLWAYVHEGAGPGITLLLATDGTFTKYFTLTVSGRWGGVNNLPTGRFYEFTKADATATGGMTWNDTVGRIRVRASGGGAHVTFDHFSFGYDPVAAVCIYFDDGLESCYDLAFPLFQARNMVATAGVISGSMNTAGYMTDAEIQEMFTDGWCISNHSNDAGLISEDADHGEASFDACKAYLDALNITTGDHFIYPGGVFDTENLANILGFGAKTARGTPANDDVLPLDENRILSARVIDSSDSVQDVKDLIDEGIADKTVVPLAFHDIVESGATGTEVNVDNLEEILDYIVTTGVAHITQKDFFDLQSGAVTVNDPTAP